MVERSITILENLGVVAIIAAFVTWNRWYQISDGLFWFASACIVPAILWKHLQAGVLSWLPVILLLALYLIIGFWWFNSPKINVRIPKLPPIIITRQA